MRSLAPLIADALCVIVLVALAYVGFGAAASADQSIVSLLRDIQ